MLLFASVLENKPNISSIKKNLLLIDNMTTHSFTETKPTVLDACL